MDRCQSSGPASPTRRRFLHRAALALAGAVALPALTGERSVLAATLAERRAPAVLAAQAGNILQVSQSVECSARRDAIRIARFSRRRDGEDILISAGAAV